jgi:hypothetical protein
MTTFARSPKSKSAGHTRLPTFSQQQRGQRRIEHIQRTLQHLSLQVAASAGIDLRGTCSCGTDSFGDELDFTEYLRFQLDSLRVPPWHRRAWG